MSFSGTTWVECQVCGAMFGCGCVLTNICVECARKRCAHDLVPFNDGFRRCKKCFALVRIETQP